MAGQRAGSILNIGVDRYVLRACQRHAAETVALCGPEPWDFGPTVPDERVRILRVDDTSSPESVLGGLHRAGLADHGFDAVHTGEEWSLVTAGLVARSLGCRGIDPTVALHFRDKFLQKLKVRDAGIATATSIVVDDIHDVDHLADLKFERSVLKPLSYGGTGYTGVVSDFQELSAASARWRARNLPQRTFVLEGFSTGDEWVADGVVFDGEVLFVALGKYGEPCLTSLSQQRALWVRRLDPDTESWAYELAGPFVQAAISALGLTNGIFHMEFFHDPDTGELTFGECAARRGGGLTQEEVLYKFNVDLAECGVLSTLGIRPTLDIRVRPETVGHTHVLGRAGTLIGYPSVSEIRDLPDVEYARFEHPFGTQFPEGFEFIGQSLGLVLVSADSEAALAARIGQLRAWIDERLVVARPHMTFREHRNWHESHWPAEEVLGGRVYTPIQPNDGGY
ncbi:ATP-grasp domain-containing protein [Longispora fulva]|uniref:Biotin carboxylase n=1 Tax=Longispora fulva TaxID=619741 RepID=A0A8J7G9B5_9ACTN|nr:hypothetical protein [Longispora fulva]MBG6134034.1 biotin carboxylase [Longispora fulva]